MFRDFTELANLGMLAAPIAEHGDKLREPYLDSIYASAKLTMYSLYQHCTEIV